MTNLLANWQQILDFARQYGLPPEKKRAIVREYLQTKIISQIYSEKLSNKLFFVGGTALRLLFGLDRFSEDLDFDSEGVSAAQLKGLLDQVAKQLKRENYSLDLYHNPTKDKDFFEFRFNEVLLESGASLEKAEKLAIKFDFESGWKGQKREIVFVNRFGFLANVLTKSLDQFVVEKLAAYLGRESTQARDLYDLVWLAAQSAKADGEFAKKNGLVLGELVSGAREKFAKEKTSQLKQSLRPFLLNESSVSKIDFFDKLY